MVLLSNLKFSNHTVSERNAQVVFSLKQCFREYFQNGITFKAVFLDVIPGWYYFYIM